MTQSFCSTSSTHNAYLCIPKHGVKAEKVNKSNFLTRPFSCSMFFDFSPQLVIGQRYCVCRCVRLTVRLSMSPRPLCLSTLCHKIPVTYFYPTPHSQIFTGFSIWRKCIIWDCALVCGHTAEIWICWQLSGRLNWSVPSRCENGKRYYCARSDGRNEQQQIEVGLKETWN